MTIAIIPARGGSKGIRLKNIQPVGGRPLIAWTIEQAVQALMVDRVVVTTDHNEIAKVASHYGAEVFWRSPETATDTATTEVALLEVLERLGYTDGVAVLLQATSPIRQAVDIDRAIQVMWTEGADSVFAARRVEGYTWQVRNGEATIHHRRVPRQQRTESTVEENGSIYVFKVKPFLSAKDRICGKSVPYLMHPLDSYQIDEPDDIRLIEQLMPVRLPHVYCAAEPH